MKVHRRTVVASSLIAAAAAWLTTAGQAQAVAPVVVHDVQASADPYGATLAAPVQPNTEIEPSIAVNPADPQNVVTDFQEGRVDAGGDADNGFATSFDGGSTWIYGNLPSITKNAPGCGRGSTLPGCAFDRASDAVVTFGKDPTGKAFHGYFVYAQSLVFDDTSQNALPSGMAINVSKDGGQTWSNGVILEQDNLAGLNDKNWVVVDNGTGLGHHTGRVYVVWDRVAPVVYSYCDPDGSATAINGTGCDKPGNWSSVHNTTFYTLFPGQGIGTMPVVLNNGDLGIMFSSQTSSPCGPTNPSPENCGTPGSSNIVWQYIPGAGTTVWPAPLADPQGTITIASYLSNGITKQRAGSLPQVAHDPVTNDVFVVWEDNRFRTDGGATPGTSDQSNQNDPVYSMSTPTAGVVGVTWSPVKRIDAGAPTNDYVDRYNPTIAVGSDGLVRVAYRQRDEKPIPLGGQFSPSSGLGTGIDTYYQESSTHGSTWSAPLKVDVTQGTPDASYGAFSRGGLFEGDYEQIAAGASGESYVTRDEAYPMLTDSVRTTASITGACPTGFSVIKPCQNQQTWVALISSSPGGGQVPEVRYVPALVLLGAAAAAVVWRRRERNLLTS